MANDLFHEELEKYVLLEARNGSSTKEKHKTLHVTDELCFSDGLTNRLLACSSGRKISIRTRNRFTRMKTYLARKRLTP